MSRDPDDSLPPRFEAAAELRGPLVLGSRVAVVLAGVALAGIILLGIRALAPLAVYWLLLSAALYASARIAAARARVAVERAGAPPVRPTPEVAPPESGEEARAAPPAESELARFGREGVAILFAVAGASGLGLSVMALRGELASAITPGLALLVAGSLALVAFACLVAARSCALLPAERLPEAAGLAEWFRGAQWLALLTGGALAARGLGLEVVDLPRWIALAGLGVCGLCAAEMSLRGLHRLFGARIAWPALGAPVHFVTLTALFHGRSPLDGLLEVAEDRFSLSLRSTWALGLVRRSLGVVLLAAASVLWLSTVLVVIGVDEQGIRFRFGRLVADRPLDPGLRLKLPWPMETVERYRVRQMQTLPLGYAGPTKESLLWTRAHAGQEYRLLLGDGRELLSVDATVTYRIGDLLAYALASQNPRETLEALAYRLLMRDTVATNLDRLLSVDREQFARRFAGRLQQACDAHGLGLEILHVSFTSLHPPVDIAAAYQAVVSAQVERQTLTARARVARETMLPSATAHAAAEARQAEAEAARRLAEAQGGAVGFQAARRGQAAAPELYRFRRRLEALEEGLLDRSLFVVDHRLTTGPGEFWIDLRSAPPNPSNP